MAVYALFSCLLLFSLFGHQVPLFGGAGNRTHSHQGMWLCSELFTLTPRPGGYPLLQILSHFKTGMPLSWNRFKMGPYQRRTSAWSRCGGRNPSMSSRRDELKSEPLIQKSFWCQNPFIKIGPFFSFHLSYRFSPHFFSEWHFVVKVTTIKRRHCRLKILWNYFV